MRALDMFIDWLAEQKMSEKVYIVKELLKELDYFERRDLIHEEIEKFSFIDLEETKSIIEELMIENIDETKDLINSLLKITMFKEGSDEIGKGL